MADDRAEHARLGALARSARDRGEWEAALAHAVAAAARVEGGASSSSLWSEQAELCRDLAASLRRTGRIDEALRAASMAVGAFEASARADPVLARGLVTELWGIVGVRPQHDPTVAELLARIDACAAPPPPADRWRIIERELTTLAANGVATRTIAEAMRAAMRRDALPEEVASHPSAVEALALFAQEAMTPGLLVMAAMSVDLLLHGAGTLAETLDDLRMIATGYDD